VVPLFVRIVLLLVRVVSLLVKTIIIISSLCFYGVFSSYQVLGLKTECEVISEWSSCVRVRVGSDGVCVGVCVHGCM